MLKWWGRAVSYGAIRVDAGDAVVVAVDAVEVGVRVGLLCRNPTGKVCLPSVILGKTIEINFLGQEWDLWEDHGAHLLAASYAVQGPLPAWEGPRDQRMWVLAARIGGSSDMVAPHRMFNSVS